MRKDTGIDIPTLKVDGGAALNGWLMQFQADILDTEIVRAADLETTALGAAFLAGLAVGYWKDLDELKAAYADGDHFKPKMGAAERDNLYSGWTAAVKATQVFKHQPYQANETNHD